MVQWNKTLKRTQKIEISPYYVAQKQHQRFFITNMKAVNSKRRSRTTLIVVPGHGSHQEFMDLCVQFAKQNVEVFLLDLIGFGFSGGSRFNASREEIFTQLQQVLSLVDRHVSLFIYAHGFGANFVVEFI